MAETEAFNVVYLPEHILIHILSCMSYSEISRIREVCQTFNRICSRELTKAFVRVDRLHSQIQKSIKSQLPRKESERRNHALSRFVDVLSALETRLSLLSMTYTKYIDLELCCFIPGTVLDELYQLLHRLQNTESQPPRAYDLLQSLRDLSTMAMEHFEEFIVPMLKAQMTERSQTLFFSPPTGSASSSSSSPLHSSIIAPTPNSLDMSAMSMLDCSWPMPLSVVSSPWRRTPLKLDVQRMQSQMQMHSAAIATMTKEYREQKVKVGEQSRIIAEQERLLLEQRRLILELKAHMVAQENNQDTLATHVTKLTGKVVHLPEALAWDPSLWDASPHRAEPPDCNYLAGRDLCDFHELWPETSRKRSLEMMGNSSPIRDRLPESSVSVIAAAQLLHQGKLVRHHAKQALTSSTATSSDEALSVEQFIYQANEFHQSLSSKCSTKRLLAQIALAIQRIAADHSLPVCLEECPSRGKGPLHANSGGGGGGGGGGSGDDVKGELLSQLTYAQHQLANFNEEHVGCAICMAEDPRLSSLSVLFPPFPCNSGRGGSEPPASSSSYCSVPAAAQAANQGLVNRAQELYNRLNGLIQEKGGPPIKPAKPACLPTGGHGDEKVTLPGGVMRRGKGKALLKRKRSVTKPEAEKPEMKPEMDKPETNSSPKYRKCRRRL